MEKYVYEQLLLDLFVASPPTKCFLLNVVNLCFSQMLCGMFS